MKVMHVIPSAFHYFDDIREAVFGIIKSLEAAGAECEAVTLQYSAPSRAVKAEIGKATGGGRHFEKSEEVADLISSFGEYDIIHLHCPFLGAAGKILAWARKQPRPPLVFTYYRGVRLEDVFSWFVSFYNDYYLRQIMKSADALCCLELAILPTAWQRGVWSGRFSALLDKKEHNPLTGAADKVKLTIPECESAASRLLDIYNKITH